MFESPNKKRHKQQQFEENLNEIVRLIKFKQQICLETIQYLQHILNNQQDLQSLMFLQDQISRHRYFLQRVCKKMHQSDAKHKNLISAFVTNLALTQTQKGLLKRVSARILQVFQTFNQKVQKFSHFEKQISLHYKSIKSKFIKLIYIVEKNGSSMTHVSQLCTAFFEYLSSKFTDQCKKLNKVVQFIQNGETNKIQDAFICQHCKQNQVKVQFKQQNKSVSLTKKQKNADERNSKDNYESKFFSKEKQKINQKLKAMRQQAKTKQMIRKKNTKFANKYLNLYHSAMDIHKGYFIEQLSFIDQNQQAARLLEDMALKNKGNQNFIKQFIHVCSAKNMQEKVRSKLYLSQNTLEVQNSVSKSEKQEKRGKQEKSLKIRKKNSIQIPIDKDQICENLKEDFVTHSISYQNYQRFAENEQKNQIKSFRITNPNKKSNIPTPKSNPNLFAIKETTQSFNFIKINMKNALNNQKSRLPDISNRLFSMDDRRKSIKMLDKQTNIATTNTNVLILKAGISKNLDSKKNQNKKKSNETNLQLKTKKMKRSESGNKLVLEKNNKGSSKTLEINYSTSISKKLNKFCQILNAKEQIY